LRRLLHVQRPARFVELQVELWRFMPSFAAHLAVTLVVI
jgi:hypothetical protein